MKKFISVILFLFIVSPSYAQNSSDRYASWNTAVSSGSVKKKVRVKAQRKQRVKRSVPAYRSPYFVRNHVPERNLAIGVVEAITEPVKQVAAQIIGGRPQGCPARFCGCALSLKLFGKIVPHLNLAANWLKFPSAAPAPGMVAARKGHVFKLLSHLGGNKWQVWDANSGGGRIRIHARSIAGYRIVNPLPS